ncbi:MAG: hypothetical protein AABX14_00405 [Candidatus Aenigmatarchaeota archaeon]
MKNKTLADTKEWKKLRKDIAKAKKDPEFNKALDRFIRMSSNHD